ncbi:MAG TPA: HAMP domain-containing sensor histidine kinase [Planctomycetaceae bacterium]|nr:HAMP domain-containing sensor histidine kinase [Planctomycetaceae bacterium]HQZ66531.1 HAMP domain-containing sensor histidine kinase [Planctomycetaceae bacterium]
MISYRALKKIVGETSLERKCRFLFGFALLVLITGSFWLYDTSTQHLIVLQQALAAKSLVPRILQLHHYRLFMAQEENAANPAEQGANDVAADTGTDDDLGVSAAAETIAGSDNTSDVSDDKAGHDTANAHRLQILFDKVASEDPDYYAGSIWNLTNAENQFPGNPLGFEARKKFLNEENEEVDEYWDILREEGKPRVLSYYSAIRLEKFCTQCHLPDGKVKDLAEFRLEDYVAAQQSEVAAENLRVLAAEGAQSVADAQATEAEKPRLPLLSIARIDLSLASVDAKASRNRAILVATGIVTAFLAMLVAYVIVRYIIVKPVLHLKDVSDEIARGNLNLRAEISTGDEFEELSHAFNRMLRHMMTVNDELRSLNVSLDGKVDQLAQANMELFNNNKLKDDFLATISHELRTPLNSILGFSDILQGAVNLDDRQKRYVQNIQTSGRSLMVQINDLLDLAKIESGKMELHLTEMNLSDVLEMQLQQIMPLADRKNIDLKADLPGEALPVVFQDSGKISQIANNLLSNAIKFTPEGGRVRVVLRQAQGGFFEFSVADTGIGIPLQEQEHIFEKFRQGSSNPSGRDHTNREYEGTGLGLSIVRELSRLLGGDVTLQSEFGKGSLFTVRLPLQAPAKKLEPLIPLESRSSPTMTRITSVDLLTKNDDSGSNGALREVPIDVQSF